MVSGQPHLESGVGPWNEVCQREAGNLTQIAKMAERTERAFPDRFLLPVKAAIYHNGSMNSNYALNTLKAFMHLDTVLISKIKLFFMEHFFTRFYLNKY